LIFTDESGFLLAPLRRTTLAPRGQTPVLAHRATHRQKVSVVAALWQTARREEPRLHYGIYPDAHLNAEDYAEFLQELVRRLRGQPAMVLHDEGGLHGGLALEEVREDQPLMGLEFLPPYAPELNPVEALWNHLKCDVLANFAPQDAAHLAHVLQEQLLRVQADHARLRTFFAATPLNW